MTTRRTQTSCVGYRCRVVEVKDREGSTVVATTTTLLVEAITVALIRVLAVVAMIMEGLLVVEVREGLMAMAVEVMEANIKEGFREKLVPVVVNSMVLFRVMVVLLHKDGGTHRKEITHIQEGEVMFLFMEGQGGTFTILSMVVAIVEIKWAMSLIISLIFSLAISMEEVYSRASRLVMAMLLPSSKLVQVSIRVTMDRTLFRDMGDTYIRVKVE